MSFLCFRHHQGLFRQWSPGYTASQLTRREERSFSTPCNSSNGWIRTLTPTLLQEEKQQILDVSGLTNPTFVICSMADTYNVPISYNPRKVTQKTQQHEKNERSKATVLASSLPLPEEIHDPFPPNTKGVFYFHSSENLHPMTDSVRFRLCDSPSTFGLGTDLLLPSKLPWLLPLWRITWHKEMEGLRHLIRSEDLVPPTFLENNEVLENLNRAKGANPLFSLRQPFVLDVNRWAHRLQLVTRQRIDTFKINQLFSDSVAKTQPYKGQILVRFELTKSHNRKQSLQMRILEHLTPVTSILPDYPGRKGRIPSLEPGSLISKKSKLGKVTTPWTYVLEARKYGEVWKRFLKHSPG